MLLAANATVIMSHSHTPPAVLRRLLAEADIVASAVGKPNLVRMTYTKGADGSVRQAGAASRDGGATWAPSFDFTYRPAP